MSDQPKPETPSPSPKTPQQEAAEILLDELHSFGRDVRHLIIEQENRIDRLVRQNRERLVDDLASVASKSQK